MSNVTAATTMRRKIQASCTVRGSINHDEYFYVNHIVRPGETLSSSGHESRVGGKGANQAVAVALAGGKARFFGTIGKDGMWIRERMSAFGIDVDGILVSEEELTGRAVIQVDERGENSIILFPGANYSTLHEQKFKTQSADVGGQAGTGSDSWFPTSTHLLLQNEIPLAATLYAAHSTKAQGATVVFNPSPLPTREAIAAFPWANVDWLVVNEAEARELFVAVSGGESPAQDQQQAKEQGGVARSRELVRALGALPAFAHTNVVCTLGAQGVLAWVPALYRRRGAGELASPDADKDRDKEMVYVPAAKLRGGAKDTTGAGDCFAGYFVCGLMELADGGAEGAEAEMSEEDLKRILKVAVQAAGMCCEKSGTIDSYPSREEVEERMTASM